MKRTPMTQRGAEALRAELKRLKSEARPHVIKAITEARGHGDLAENAEYHAAREQQGFIEGRIKDIEHKLANAEVIDPAQLPTAAEWCSGPRSSSRTRPMARVSSTRWSGRTRRTSAPAVSRSPLPIARALVGKSQGEVVDVSAPGRHALLRDRRGAPRLGFGDEDARQSRTRTVEHRDVADTLDHGAAGGARQRREQCIAHRAVPARRPDLDELVIVQGARGLGGDCGRHTRAAEPYQRLQGVRQAAQMTQLRPRELGSGGAAAAGPALSTLTL